MLKIKMKTTGAPVPFYASEGAAGFDIRSIENTIVYSGDKAIISTGLFLEIPKGYEMQIRPRSGLAASDNITVLNSPGTIDADFRGEIKIILINHGDKPFKVVSGNRIAQGIISPVLQAKFELVEELSDTERGSGGFGSTGA
jgi:dUTP pyrophosphatase